MAVSGVGAAAVAETLIVGTNAAFADPILTAAAEAKKAGLDVKVIEYTDPVSPNTALASGEIDANYFQHGYFLDTVKQARNLYIVPFADGIVNKTGLYSKKHKSLDALPDGARVALAGDPVNFGRGLRLLEKAGLIELKPEADLRATTADIAANPKNLKIIEVDFHQLPLSLDEVDLAHGYTHFLLASGVIDPASALFWEPESETRGYGIKFVIRPEGRDNPRIAEFVKIYQTSPAVRKVLDDQYGDLYFRLWEKD
ncbi:MetQ/NlpA family ABC transporter substrate-binding protein [Pseudochelatococcus contaminans]|uniref:D-methionine transport system substrate-binding protein n=1 Tax=Pseudochelatococcus contaminans TaxID=1538103 RepID=A0A7W6EFX8_9HYPH|nr:MetQ/NlpA family ABC transporter substrate-binding protein [Pseudochelatococcus contaminans]MBB3808582.1 D-methionine transport system substrate-binding protein [Pseudochelatococcus contaminans]